MRNRLRLTALGITAVLLIAACSQGSSVAAPPAASAAAPSESAAAPAESASASPEAAAATPEPAKACAQSTAPGAMQMWERSGGNKGMVDILVCAWNAANPDKTINLSYIP